MHHYTYTESSEGVQALTPSVILSRSGDIFQAFRFPVSGHRNKNSLLSQFVFSSSSGHKNKQPDPPVWSRSHCTPARSTERASERDRRLRRKQLKRRKIISRAFCGRVASRHPPRPLGPAPQEAEAGEDPSKPTSQFKVTGTRDQPGRHRERPRL